MVACHSLARASEAPPAPPRPHTLGGRPSGGPVVRSMELRAGEASNGPWLLGGTGSPRTPPLVLPSRPPSFGSPPPPRCRPYKGVLTPVVPPLPCPELGEGLSGG